MCSFSRFFNYFWIPVSKTKRFYFSFTIHYKVHVMMMTFYLVLVGMILRFCSTKAEFSLGYHFLRHSEWEEKKGGGLIFVKPKLFDNTQTKKYDKNTKNALVEVLIIIFVLWKLYITATFLIIYCFLKKDLLCNFWSFFSFVVLAVFSLWNYGRILIKKPTDVHAVIRCLIIGHN